MTKNESVLNWIENMKKLVNPDKVCGLTAPRSSSTSCAKRLCSTGEMIKLNEE